MRTVIADGWVRVRPPRTVAAAVVCTLISALPAGAVERSLDRIGVIRSPFESADTAAPAADLFPALFGERMGEPKPPLPTEFPTEFAPGNGELPPRTDFGASPLPNAGDAVVTVALQDPVPIAPIPAALPLFATGIALLGWLARPRAPNGKAGGNNTPIGIPAQPPADGSAGRR